MKERLVIKNFGPIKSVDLELGKMTILIGEQATGKSTIAKVLAVCRYFSFITDATNNLIYTENIYFDNILKEYGLHEYINEESYILYDNFDYKLQVEIFSDGNILSNLDKNLNQPILKFHPKILERKSERFKLLMEEFDRIKPKDDFSNIILQHIKVNWNIPTTFLLNEVKDVMNNPFYFPTERGLQSVFSLGKDSLQNLSSLLYNQFVRLHDISKNYSKEIYIKPLDIFYKNENGVGFVKKGNDESFHTLSNGASGYQSVTPIFLGINFYTNFENRKERIFIVEEPELNLFPKAQKKLMEFFVENINTNGHSFLLPTHSPYVLSSLNNLVYAYSIGHLNNGIFKERVDKIISEKYWLDPNDISVYYLNIDGTSKDIFDREDNLINTDYIDSVSRIISKEFDELLNMEVSLTNKDNE